MKNIYNNKAYTKWCVFSFWYIRLYSY